MPFAISVDFNLKTSTVSSEYRNTPSFFFNRLDTMSFSLLLEVK